MPPAAARSRRCSAARIAGLALAICVSGSAPATFAQSRAGASPSAPATFEQRFAVCLACHGASGRSLTPLTPSLGGQPAFFAMTQLFLLRDGRRGEPVMIEQAKGMSNDDLRAFSDAIAKLPPPPPPAERADPLRFERGRSLAAQHRCGVCHNPDYSGREQMPRLANQREDYLLKAMREFASGKRLGYGAAMTQELSGLSHTDLGDLAHFLAHQPAREPAGARPPR
jgi:cytochrome c553